MTSQFFNNKTLQGPSIIMANNYSALLQFKQSTKERTSPKFYQRDKSAKMLKLDGHQQDNFELLP